jgi:hypothetical protein
LHVLPRKTELALCTVVGDDIVEHLRLPHEHYRVLRKPDSEEYRALHESLRELEDKHPYRIPRAVSLDKRSVAFAPAAQWAKSHSIHLVRLNESLTGMLSHAILDCPANFTPEDLCFHGKHLYVAGGGGTSQLAYLDMESVPDTWNRIELPFKEWNTRKSIDAILFDGNRLIAVDNFVIPKYLIECDTAHEPVAKNLVRLANHGTYEWIAAASIGARWIALLSATQGWGVVEYHISIMARRTLLEHGWFKVISTFSRDFWASVYGGIEKRRPAEEEYPRQMDDEEFREWHDLAFCGDKLLVAAGEDGLGVLDLSKESPDRSRKSCSKTFSRRCLSRLTYREAGTVSRCNAFYVEAVDSERAIVTHRTDSDLESVVVRV